MSNANATVMSTLKINECVKLISAIGATNAFVIEGEPGTGKSTILKMLEDIHGPAYNYVYLDCPTVGEGSLVMDVPDRDTKKLETYLSSRLKIDAGKPVIIMLDEYLKVAKLLKVLFTRLLLEKVIGDTKLPEGSIIFATSNNSTDGVNDTIEAHVGNRVGRIKMAKPTHKEWNLWATENGISALTRSWVAINTRCMRSYLEADQEDNPFIFNPRRAGSVSFVSPRSLAKADNIIKAKSVIGEQVAKAALMGTLGQAAGESMGMFLQMEQDVIPIQTILKDPKNTRIPDDAGPLLMTLFNAADVLETQDEVSSFMGWVDRIQSIELQGVFFTMFVQGKRTTRMAMRNDKIRAWAEQNFDLL
jgi:energy-coupling factor transporter ATP-binding protein EcfA2